MMFNDDDDDGLNANEGAAETKANGKRKHSDSENNGEEHNEMKAKLFRLDGGKTTDFSQPLEVLLKSLPSDEKEKFLAADNRRKDDNKKIMAAHSHLVETRKEFDHIQKELDKAQKAYDKAKALSQKHSEQDADNLLLEPTEWNSRYAQLKAYFDIEGHSHLKRNITDSDIESMSDEEAAELKALSRWASRQRKFKRNSELEHYKVLLLNRLNFDWDPKVRLAPIR